VDIRPGEDVKHWIVRTANEWGLDPAFCAHWTLAEWERYLALTDEHVRLIEEDRDATAALLAIWGKRPDRARMTFQDLAAAALIEDDRALTTAIARWERGSAALRAHEDLMVAEGFLLEDRRTAHFDAEGERLIRRRSPRGG
jgi:hypothetical protein